MRLTFQTKSDRILYTAMRPLAFSLPSSARRHLIVYFYGLVVLCGLANSDLRSEPVSLVGDPLRVPLTAKNFDERSLNGNLMSRASRGTQALREKPASQIKSEPALQHATYYRLALGGREFLAILDVGKDAERADLYIDFEGKGNFDAIKGIEGVDQYKGRNPEIPYASFKFGPITLPKTEEAVAGPVMVAISCTVSKKEAITMPYLRISPQKFVTGKLRLGAGEYTVAFVDGALNGRFEPLKPNPSDRQPAMAQVYRKGATMMAVDLNKNGMLDWKGEISPLVDIPTLTVDSVSKQRPTSGHSNTGRANRFCNSSEERVTSIKELAPPV